eukprot:Gb_24617 [translate_table: standard]
MMLRPLFGVFIAHEFLGLDFIDYISFSAFSQASSIQEFMSPRFILSYWGVLLLALFGCCGTRCYKPYLQAFGADHFHDEDPKERKYKSSQWHSVSCISSQIFKTILDGEWDLASSFGHGSSTICARNVEQNYFRHELPDLSVHLLKLSESSL